MFPDVTGTNNLGEGARQWASAYINSIVSDDIFIDELVISGSVPRIASNTGEIYFGNANLIQIKNISADYFIGDGSQLSNVNFTEVGLANYQFTNNNFNGTGNFTTIGKATALSGFDGQGAELIDDVDMDNAGSEWDEGGGWSCTAGVCSIGGGLSGNNNETNPFVPVNGKPYTVIIDVTDIIVGSGNPLAMFGGNVLRLTGLGNNVFVITANATNQFSLQKTGGAPLSVTSVTIKEIVQSNFGDVVIQNNLITRDLNVTGTPTLNSLNIIQTPTVAPISDVLRVIGASPSDASFQGSSITLTAGDGSGTGIGGNVTITSGGSVGGTSSGDINLISGSISGGTGGDIFLTTGGSAFGNVIMVKDGGKIFIGKQTSFNFNESVLEIQGNVTINGSLFTFSPLLTAYDYNSAKRIDDLPHPTNTLDLTGHLDYNTMFEDEWRTTINYPYLKECDKGNCYDTIDFDRPTYLNETDVFQVGFNNRILINELVEEIKWLKDNCVLK